MIIAVRKKPIIVHALQWTGKNLEEVYSFVGPDNVAPIERRPDYELKIKTLESGGGYHVVDVGDWIIEGIKGEFYPCKPDIFKESYQTEF